MSQLHFYVPDDLEAQIRQQAQQLNLSVPKYLAELVKRELATQQQLPDSYVALFDQWQGEASQRPEQLPVDERLGLHTVYEKSI